MRSVWPLCAAFAPLLSVAPAAQAAEIQRPEEQLTLELHGKQGFAVYFLLYPNRHVAIMSSQRGIYQAEAPHGRWLGAAYAVHASPGALAGVVHLRLGQVGSLRGHFVADESPHVRHHNPFCRGRASLSESGHFVGRIVFRGDGGYLNLSARRANAYRSRSFRLRCRNGHAHHEYHPFPGLFGYLEPPMIISSQDSTFLLAHTKTKHRVLEFQAAHHLREQSTTFRAAVLEWLPEHVATMRWVEASRVAASAFQVDESERHPRTATVTPPAPFHGEAIYTRERQKLRGNLRASFLGESLRITGHGAEAELCRGTPEEPSWLCT